MTGQSPSPAATTDPVVLAKLDALMGQMHDLQRQVSRLAIPVEVVTTDRAAELIGRTTRTVQRLIAYGTFTDARAPGRRTNGAPRLIYVDEIEVYRREGERGVWRLREQLGRLEPGEEPRGEGVLR